MTILNLFIFGFFAKSIVLRGYFPFILELSELFFRFFCEMFVLYESIMPSLICGRESLPFIRVVLAIFILTLNLSHLG